MEGCLDLRSPRPVRTNTTTTDLDDSVENEEARDTVDVNWTPVLASTATSTGGDIGTTTDAASFDNTGGRKMSDCELVELKLANLLSLMSSCGLDSGMPLRTSSLSSERLNANAPLGTRSSTTTQQPIPAGSGNSSSGVLMRHSHTQRRGSLQPQGSRGSDGGQPAGLGMLQGSPRPHRPMTVGYELSADIRAKEIELTEKCYGGRALTQRSARIIQSSFRDYRMRKEFVRICSEKRTSRRIEMLPQKSVVEETWTKEPLSQSRLSRQLSVEDLVLAGAYKDWRQGGPGSSTNNEDTCSINSDPTQQRRRGRDATDSPRDSGVDAGEDSGPSASNSMSSMNSAHSTESSTTSSSVGTVVGRGLGGSTGSLVTSPPRYPVPSHQRTARISAANHYDSSPVRRTDTLEHHESPRPPHTPTCSTATPKGKAAVGTRRALLSSAPRLPETAVLGNPYTEDKRQKRLYRIGLDILNKSPAKGIDYLIKHEFLESSPSTIARFLISRKGISRVAIGDFLGLVRNDLALNVTRQFLKQIDLQNKEVDVALRHFMSFFRNPGESQKIQHIMDVFQETYVEQNPIRASAQFRNMGTIMVLSYAIIMLHTDLYNRNVRKQNKMSREAFVKNLGGVDDNQNIDENLLLAIYDRIRAEEMKPLPDHTDQVRKINDHLVGAEKPNLVEESWRRLVCYCRLHEVPDVTKKDRLGSHQRDIFLFNDMLLITKAVQKKKDDSCRYQVRKWFRLLGVQLCLFESTNYTHGIQVRRVLDGEVLVTLCARTAADRDRFVEDLQECVIEMAEMDRIRIDEEFAKQQRGQPVSTGNQSIKVTTEDSKSLGGLPQCDSISKTSLEDASPFSPQSQHSRSSSRSSNSSHSLSHKSTVSNSSSSATHRKPSLAEHRRLIDGDGGLVLELDKNLS